MSKQHGPIIGDDLRKEVEEYQLKKKGSSQGSVTPSNSGGTASQAQIGGEPDNSEILGWARPQARAPISLDNPHPGVPVAPLEEEPIPEAAKHVIGSNPFTAIQQQMFPPRKLDDAHKPAVAESPSSPLAAKTPKYNVIGKNPFTEIQERMAAHTAEQAEAVKANQESKAAEASYWNLPMQFLQEIPKSVYATIGQAIKTGINELSEKPEFADVHEDDTSENLATKYLNGMMSIVRRSKPTDILNPVSALIERVSRSTQSAQDKHEAVQSLKVVESWLDNHTNDMNKWQAENPVPDGIISGTVKGIASMVPDIALASLGTAGKGAAAEKYVAGLTEKAPAIVAKYAPKAAAFMERAVTAPFTKVMAGKGALEGGAQGGPNTDGNIAFGALKGGGEGLYMHSLGEMAGAASPYIARLIGKTGAASTISTLIANPLANMGVFSAGKTARTLATEGRLPTEEEIAHEAAMGFGFSLLHAASLYKTHTAANRFYEKALTDDPLQSLGRVLNDEHATVAANYDPNLDVASLKKARTEIHKAIKVEPDLETKRALGDEAIKIQDQLDAHDAVKGIVSDPKGVVNMIAALPLSDDMKLSYIDQAGKIYKAFSPREQKIQSLAAEVKQHEEAAKQHEEAAKTSTDPVESVSHEAAADEAKKAAVETKEALKNALKEDANIPVEEEKPAEQEKNDLLAEFESGLDALKKPEVTPAENKEPEQKNNTPKTGGVGPSTPAKTGDPKQSIDLGSYYNENGDRFIVRSGNDTDGYVVQDRSKPNMPFLTVPAEEILKQNLSRTKPVKIESTDQPDTNVAVTSMKVADIKTDEKRFQNRDALDQGRVDDIAKNFDANKFDPITVMPDGTVLSGHHRFAVAKKLGMADIPVKVFQGTEQEAQDFARDSNTLGKQETATERAKRYRELRSSGRSEKEIAQMAKQAHGSEATKILNLSRLDPKGKAIHTIQQFEESTDTDTKSKTQALGDWIGHVKGKHGDLSRRQENEMFDYLQGAYSVKKGAGKITNKSQFMELSDALITRLKDRGGFNEDTVINFKNQIGKTGIELEYDAALEEAKKNFADAETSLGDKRAQLLTDGATKADLDRIMPKYEEQVQVALKNLEDLRKQRGLVAETVKRQQSIFDQIDNTPENEKSELDTKVSETLIPTDIEPGQSGTGDQGSSNGQEEPAGKQEPEVEEAEPVSERDQLDKDIDDAFADFAKAIRKSLNAMGLSTEIIEKGLKLMGLYTKKGVFKFEDMITDAKKRFGDIKDLVDGMKAAYSAHYSQAADEVADKMTDLKEVRKFDYEKFIKENGTGSEPNTLDENSSAVSTRQQPGTTEGNVPSTDTKTVSGTSDANSGEAGNEVKRSGESKPAGDRGKRVGTDTSTGSGPESNGSGADAGGRVQKNIPKREVKPEDRNHVIEPADTIVPKGAVGKVTANMDAIFLSKRLETENRNPTAEEKKVLAQFIGWGGLSKYLDINYYAPATQGLAVMLRGGSEYMFLPGQGRTYVDFSREGALDLTQFTSFDEATKYIKNELSKKGVNVTLDDLRAPVAKSLLTTEEFNSAIQSTTSAHFTDRRIIDGLWNIASRLGFKGGSVLESSAGIGHIFGLMPKKLAAGSMLTGYELEQTTGNMLRRLYPQAKITVGGFEASKVPFNSVDLAITNVPFGKTAPYDKANPELSKFSLHNYFIAKNLKTLKPGGLGIMITSASTMDAGASVKFREWASSAAGGNSFLVGAIRLPNNAFSENAGTEVTSDILVFQKRSGTTDPTLEQSFRYSKMIGMGTDSEGNPVSLDVNEYYHEHPENILGDVMTANDAGSGALYGNGSSLTVVAKPGMDIEKEIAKLIKTLPENINESKAVEAKVQDLEEAADQKEGSLFLKGGKPHFVEEGMAKPAKLNAKDTDKAIRFVGMRDDLNSLMNLERNTVGESKDLEDIRAALNQKYDDYVAKHGNLNARTSNFLDDLDTDFPIVASIETVKRKLISEPGKRDRMVDIYGKAGILSHRINFPRTDPTTAANMADAIDISMNIRNGLNLEYMASLLGTDPEVVKETLLREKIAFENPATGLVELPDEYLSGYVREKLENAKAAAANDPRYRRNVEELEKVIPENIPAELISFSIGSAWVPGEVYDSFASDVFKVDTKIKFMEATGKFSVATIGGAYRAENTNTYAAGGKTAIEILTATLNNTQIVITETQKTPEGGTRQVKNIEKTAAAQAMQEQLQELFAEWVMKNDMVKKQTEEVYNNQFNGQVIRQYRAPSFTHYPGANVDITLREHQKKAVTRGLSESTLFAHDVGTGKTFTMITTAMEMRRLGTARKPMIVVQNATKGQFITSFKTLYPGAKILAPTQKEMAEAGRKKLFAKIATGDWDAIIIPQSQFSRLPDDPERETAYIREQIDEMIAAISQMDPAGDHAVMRQMQKSVERLEDAIFEIQTGEKVDRSKGSKTNPKKIAAKAAKVEAAMRKSLDRRTDKTILFENTGVDALLVDEAHEYKRLGFATSMQNIKGIDTSKSQKSQSVLLKTRWIQEKTGGKNVLFYTGTPISNTMAEAWTMLKYVRPDILQKIGIEHFDQFAKTFGQVVPSLEQTGGGTFKIQSRFAKFQNLPEFITAFRTATDVVLTEDVKEFMDSNTLPKLLDGKIQQKIIPRSPELIAQIQQFKDTLEWFDNLSGKEKKENSHIPLVIFGKAKQASIDLRLLDPENVDSPGSKVNVAIKNALDIYKRTTEDLGTQMIFSDMYQSPDPKKQFLDDDETIVNPAYGKERFNLFEDIKAKLVANGVPENEIAILTEDKYEKPERKEQLFADMNAGKIRFALGTTARMGVGVNAQDKLFGLHHIDAPNRPMDFTQRNGRIVRQGNQFEIVEVYAYGVEKTLDASAFQRLATKSGFINQVMKGGVTDRVTEDPAEGDDMTFEEMMAQLSDSPYALKKLMVDNKIRSEQMKLNNYRVKVTQNANSITKTKEALERNKMRLQAANDYVKLIDEKMPDGNVTTVTVNDVDYTEKFGEAISKYIDILEKKLVTSKEGKSMGFVKINGLVVGMEMRLKDGFDSSTKLVTKVSSLNYTVPEVGLVDDGWGQGIDVPSVSGSGLLSSFRARVSGVIDEPAEYERKIRKQEEFIETMSAGVNEGFDETKLNALKAESEELKQKMLADDKNPSDDPDPDGGGEPFEDEEVSDAEFIMDQENIKGALDFLDNLKIKGKKLYGMIVPIPPQLWNGAIEVMKTVLKATNSAQKAIRVAAKYMERNGTKAQAKEFENEINKSYGPGSPLAEKLKTVSTKIAESRKDLKTQVESIDVTAEPKNVKAELVNILAEARKTNLIKTGMAKASLASIAIEKTAVIRNEKSAAEAVEAVQNLLNNVGQISMLKYADSAKSRLKSAYEKNKMGFSVTSKQLMQLDPKSLTREELNDYLELAPTLASQLEGMQAGMVSDVEIGDFVDRVVQRQEDELKDKLIRRYKKLNLDNSMSVKDMYELINEDKESRGVSKAKLSKSEFASRDNKRREIMRDILSMNRDDLAAKRDIPAEKRKIVDDLLSLDEAQLGTSDINKLNTVIANIVSNDRYTGAGYFSKVAEGIKQIKEYSKTVESLGGGFRPITFDGALKNKVKGSNLNYLSLTDKFLHLNTFRQVGLATDNMISAPINVGHSKQAQEMNAVMDGLDNVIKKNGLHKDREAIYRVGVFGELNAYMVGGAERGVQFKNNMEMLRRSIEVLGESKNKHEKSVHKILTGIYDEISGAESIDELQDMLTPQQQAVYDYIQAVGRHNQSRLNDNNEAYGDKPMKEKANYVHRRYAKLYDGPSDVDLVSNDPITMTVNGMLGQAGTKQDVIARRNLPEGKYVDYNIYKSFRLGLNETLSDIHTLGDRIKANYILNSPAFEKTLRVGNDSGKKNLRIIKDSVQQMVNLQRGVARLDIDQDSVGRKMVSFFKQTFYGSAVGTATAAIPQYASSVAFTLTNLKNPTSFLQALRLFAEGDNVFQQISGLFGGGKGTAKEFIKAASGGTANRDLQGDNQLEDAMNNLSDNVFGSSINPKIAQMFDALNSKFYASLKYGDRMVSLHTWLAGYIDNLIEQGVIKNASEFDLNMLKQHLAAPNDLAATNGETMVSLSNNDSDSSRRANGFVPKTFGDELKIDWLYPVKKFAVGANNKLWLGIRNLSEWEGGQGDGLRMIMGTLAMIAVYAAVREFIINKFIFDPAGKAVTKALGMQSSDEAEQKKLKMTDEQYQKYQDDKSLTKFGVGLVSDVILGGQNVVIEKGAENFANAMWKNFGSEIQKDAKKKKEFAPYDLFYVSSNPSSMMGIYSKPLGLILDVATDERSPLAVAFDIGHEWEDSTQDEKIRRALFSVGIPLATQFILPSADLERVNNRVKNRVEQVDNLRKDIKLRDVKNSGHKKSDERRRGF